MTSLSTKLADLERAGKPVQVGIIGAGKFGSMYISQSHRTAGIHLAAIADLSQERALAALKRTGYPENNFDATASLSISEGIANGKTTITTDSAALIATPEIDVILEVSGNPAAGIRHALLCCEHKKHIVMINVEADVLAGPLLARKAREAGIIYSMAYGDQPALIAEMVDWARTAGFEVVCAGKGTKHLPEYHYSTPDTVWNHYGFTKEQLAGGDFNPQMFNSFLDGTKSALEMAAVANGCDLSPPTNGLSFPPCGVWDLPNVLKPISEGGQLEKTGTVEIVSCMEEDGRWVFNNLRWGVYVIIKAPGEYQRECFKQYGLKTDPSGWYAAQYKPYHLIGLELGISVATIMVRGEPTGQTKTWAGDVVATAKRDLKAGETLDGEGGFTVYGKLMTAEDSMAIEGLPIGLAHGFVLKRDVQKDHGLSWQDVEYSEKTQAVAIRKEMEAMFKKEFQAQKSGGVNGLNGVNGVH
ncbi:SAF domain-containing protein [Colletotrichum phormii]|uniref:SAF domain-containing protein n=1 Tax=Colletotrichum phormii TaxID=359342 RepID=A0AAJ0E8J0_9PEZI|nr:SAF domain-containing protein [Colletotrichum phormii]KAK1621735.1 SAF domain-containing protein [Colletotrichum phormii]